MQTLGYDVIFNDGGNSEYRLRDGWEEKAVLGGMS